jgi:hypothetical protein
MLYRQSATKGCKQRYLSGDPFIKISRSGAKTRRKYYFLILKKIFLIHSDNIGINYLKLIFASLRRRVKRIIQVRKIIAKITKLLDTIAYSRL